ncbi:HEAT repeat domain-containing protein [Streptomyces sp. NPDC057939]|uniref:HEAT repeat domain-containing protein n=1 Tax=Streptomyces sp. NPDC057939 TaxID=3346284 RepID=UPI0036ECEE8F
MGELDVRLVGAVGAGDADAVRGLVEAGADPDAVGADGLPVLCGAVTAFAVDVVRALVEAGADPDRVLPDGTTALLRAVEGGSPAVWEACTGARVRERLPEGERARLLEVARRWYEAGAEAELRRLTGVRGPARVEVVAEGEFGRVEEITLGGRTVRGGHGAVLTGLEWEFRILAPVDELMGRGTKHEYDGGDEEPVDRSAVRWALGRRESAETWLQVVEYRRHPSPAYRAFVAEFLRMGPYVWGSAAHAGWYEKELLALLPGWAEGEPDGGVLALVLGLFHEEGHPRAAEFGLRYAGHPDVRVRRGVPQLLDGSPDPGAWRAVRGLGRDPDSEVRRRVAEALDGGREEDREVMLALLGDEDPEVRAWAVNATGFWADRSPEIGEALWGQLDAEDGEARLDVAFTLARRNDPRTREAYERVGPLGPEYEGDHRLDGLWRWESRNEGESPSGV